MKSFRGGDRPILGVFGGAFDPPHLGHAMVPPYLFARGLVDELVVAPCADHPFGKEMRPFEERLRLTRVAMAAVPLSRRVVVTDLEQALARAHGGPSTTLRLLEALQRERPDAHVRLIVGSDIVEDGQTSRWHRWDAIERAFTPIVVPRAGAASSRAGEPSALPAISSTAVRATLAAWVADRRPEDRQRLVAALPAGVLDHLIDPGVAGPPVWVVGRGNVAAHAEPWLRSRGRSVVSIGGHALLADPEAAIAAGRQDAAARGSVGAHEQPAAVWVLVRDPIIAAAAQALADVGLSQGVAVLHGAGALAAADPGALGVLADRGHPVAALHPICSLRREHPWPSALSRATFGLQGDPAAKAIARAWVGDQPVLELDGLDARGRSAYHAACALAANHVAVLQESAAQVLRQQGHPAALVAGALTVLLQSALDNLVALGVPAGITGPAVRGDTATVRAHVDALDDATAELYAMLSARLSTLLADG